MPSITLRSFILVLLATAAGWASAHPGHGEHSLSDILEHLVSTLLLAVAVVAVVGTALQGLSRLWSRRQSRSRARQA